MKKFLEGNDRLEVSYDLCWKFQTSREEIIRMRLLLLYAILHYCVMRFIQLLVCLSNACIIL